MRYILYLLIFSFSGFSAVAQEKAKVLVLEIRNDIDPSMNRYVELGLDEAEQENYDYIIIHMDTYGGAVIDAKDIVENLLNTDIPIWVFIDKDAASAGALISIASDSIYMAAGASIGAATVVTADGAAAPDKYQSYMRSTMRSVAEEKGRDPRIAEAMVDENIEIEGITEKGEVITFSTYEAIEHGFAEAKVESIHEILERNGVGEYDITIFELDTADEIIAFFLNPVISSLLILLIIGGLWFELQTPGIGFPLAIAILAAILYFTPYYLNGLAENWEIIAFFIGMILILLEIFVIPGFGVAGILGIIFMGGSLILVMINNDFFDFSFVGLSSLIGAVLAALLGILGAIVALFVGGVRLTESKAFSRVALTDTMDRSQGYTSSFYQPMTGRRGITQTVLRPSGRVLIEDEIYDAYTRGGYIEKGVEVEVISDEGTSLKVREVKR
jgi:membrane-bound serine protease (ClpP class)